MVCLQVYDTNSRTLNPTVLRRPRLTVDEMIDTPNSFTKVERLGDKGGVLPNS